MLEHDQQDPPIPRPVRVSDAQRIDDASESQYNLRYDDSETTRLADDISEVSQVLSKHVTDMMHNLASFVSVLEEAQVAMKKEPSLAEQILGWLKYLFNAITRILATVCPPISALLLHSAEPKVQMYAFALSTLGQAAAIFCTVGSGAFLEHVTFPLRGQK